MYTSHSYPYQIGNQQPPPPPAQYPNPYAQQHPQPYQTSPYQPPRYPNQPQPPQHPSPQPPAQYNNLTPSPSGNPPPVPTMPVLHKSEPGQSTGTHEVDNTRFVLLWSMDTEELTSLLEDEDKVNEVVTSMEEFKQKKLEKEMAMAENRSLAEFNLSREPRLIEGRAQLIARLQEAHRLRDSYSLGKAKLASAREQTSLDTAIALMQAATANAEDESEEVADDFLKGDVSVEDFLEQFVPKRQTAHLRHIKSEKMQEIMTQRRHKQSNPTQGGLTPHPSYPRYHNSPQTQQHIQSPPYGYQPQRQAPPVPYQGAAQYGPPALPTLGAYPR